MSRGQELFDPREAERVFSFFFKFFSHEALLTGWWSDSNIRTPWQQPFCECWNREDHQQI